MASSSKIRLRAPATPTLPKIVLRKRGAAQADSDEDDDAEDGVDNAEEAEDGTEAIADDDDDDDAHDAEQDDDNDAGPEPEVPAYVPRPRGRPRGSGRPRGTGRPRGRPRGSGRRGSGRGRAVYRPLPDDRDRDSDDDDSTRGTPAAWAELDGEDAPYLGGKTHRRIKGEMYTLENDEVVIPNDPKGEEKIDENGVLQGGRQFKASTFTISTRPNPHRHYMLAIDAARSSGFRDSLYFFRRNPLMLKLTLTHVEKEFLIDNGNLSAHLRSRSVTMVSARAAYKLLGAKLIKDGRWVVDDYYEDQALTDTLAKGLQPGDPVGELGEPQGYGQAVASAQIDAPLGIKPVGDSASIYKSGGPTTFFGGTGMGVFAQDGEPAPGRARRPTAEVMRAWEGINTDWMLLTSRAVGEVNEHYARMRREALKAYRSEHDVDEVAREAEQVTLQDATAQQEHATKRAKTAVVAEPALGVYESHTGLVHYRADTQPTRARWQRAQDSSFKAIVGGTRAGSQAWALARVDYVLETTSAADEEDILIQERQTALATALTEENPAS